MTDSLDFKSVLDAAQEAAGRDDYEEAERLLRKAASIQEKSLGPTHPELATTLNNLALVCERLNKVEEAERGYRRAHAIAVASLSPGHPFIATSLKNLLEFCAARGIPVWAPPAPEISVEKPTPAPELAFKSEVQVPKAQESKVQESRVQESNVQEPEIWEPAPLESKVPETRIVEVDITPYVLGIAALIVAVLAAVVFGVVWRSGSQTPQPQAQQATAPSGPPGGSTSQDPPSNSDQAPGGSTKQDPPYTTDPARGGSTNPPDERSAPAPPLETSRRETPPPTETPRLEDAPLAAMPVTVLQAQVCSDLERTGSPDWQCTPVGAAGQPGTFSFYTRLQSNADTTVEHRWYYDGRLHQRMRLRVGANQGSGFRTYSSNTVSPDRAGDWKVELRTADGTLLREEQFVVR